MSAGFLREASLEPANGHRSPGLARQALGRGLRQVVYASPGPGPSNATANAPLPQVIGKGSFKTVYRGAWHNTAVAVVAMRRGGLVAEARLLQRLSTHPNLVQLYR